MNRIFPILVLTALAMLATAMFVGFQIELPAAGSPDATPSSSLQAFRLHFLLGIAAALTVMLVHGIVVTYFIGTSRWCKEVVIAYGLDESLAARSAKLKRRTFPLAFSAMLSVVATVALGASADPATRVAPITESLPWSQVHLGVVLLSLVWMLVVHYLQWLAISENQQLITELTALVRTIRQEKGLD